MTSCYEIIDIINNITVYAGITDHFNNRRKDHWAVYEKNKKMREAIQKNPNNYKMIELGKLPRNEAEQWEITTIKEKNLQKVGWNIHRGGGFKSDSIPVFCITNGILYSSTYEAEYETGCDNRRISARCNDTNKFSEKKSAIKSKYDGKNYLFIDPKNKPLWYRSSWIRRKYVK